MCYVIVTAIDEIAYEPARNGSSEVHSKVIKLKSLNFQVKNVLDSKVILAKLQAHHFGMFCCMDIAFPPTGPVQPVAPINLRSRNTGATSATIEWTVPIVIYTPESYVVNYIAGACLGQPLMSVPVQSGTDFVSENQIFSADLTGLVDNTTYSYQVVATNSVGSTTSAPQSFIFSDPCKLAYAVSLGLYIF